MPKKPAKKFVLIDGKSVFYRGYYAMPGLTTQDGTSVGGVYGFASMALELIKKLDPDYVAVAWDKPKTNIRKRLEIYPEYKAGRKPPPQDFYDQIPILRELLAAFGWPLYELDDYEADDIMGTLAKQGEAQGIESMLISSDLDMLQLVDHDTHLYALKRGFTQIEKFDIPALEAKYGLRKDQFLDLKSLKGDSSDNIPGVPGIGEKTAVALLSEFGTLDEIYANLDSIKPAWRAKLESGRDLAYMSKKLGTIWCDAPIKLDLGAVDVRNLNTEKLRNELKKLEFNSLLRRLPEYMKCDDGVCEDLSAYELASTEVTMIDDKARVLIQMAPRVAVAVIDDTAILSVEKGTAYRVCLAEAAAILAGAKVVAHDGKFLCEKLLEARHSKLDLESSQSKSTTSSPVQTASRREVETSRTADVFAGDEAAAGDIFQTFKLSNLPTIDFDTRQTAFLLNSLRKAPTLAEAVDVDLSGDTGAMTISALWSLYETQHAKLVELSKLNKLAHEIDFPLAPVLAKIEQRGVRLDTKSLAKMSDELAVEIAETEQKIYADVGYEFNVASPAQLADVLYGKLQLPTAGIKKGKTGYSTGQKELDKLRGQHPIIEHIERIREISKLKNTYVDALPKLVDARNYLHTNLDQAVAATGRLSSSDPNLQNIPTRTPLGQKLRKSFIASDGKVLVSADYSQFELRLAAAMAHDTNLIEDFQNDEIDIHTKTAAEAYGVSIENVTPLQRRHAKVINFGVLYGMSPHGLAAATGMSFSQAKEFIDRYFRVRKPIRDYIDATIAKAEKDGYVETLFGRRRPTPDVKSNNFMVREAAKRAAANMPMQGTEADLMKMAMLRVENEVKNASQILQIHDSIMVECDPADVEKVSQMMKNIMENIYPEIGVRLKVDVKHGANWGEL